jgi:NADPH:quinone reductase-like Zn-dependent oxidoreductase
LMHTAATFVRLGDCPVRNDAVTFGSRLQATPCCRHGGGVADSDRPLRNAVRIASAMKAMVYKRYGSPEDIEIAVLPRPSPKDGEVLIKVHAASLNLADWEMLIGKPLYARIWGLFKPRFNTLGSDVAGRVEAVGKNVTRLRPGDEVFGDIMGTFGAFAEYVCAPPDMLVAKPAGRSFEEMATLPQAAVIALRGICDVGQVQRGQKVLINGAGGGSGVFAIQLAKSRGAIVTGVDNSKKQDFMRSMGADQVVDYAREDFTRNDERYDLILDLVAHRSIFDHRRALAPRGRYLLVGGSMLRLFQNVLLGPPLSWIDNRKLAVLGVAPKREDLEAIKKLLEDGTLEPVIERRYSLSEVAEALRYVGHGEALGKVVITM